MSACRILVISDSPSCRRSLRISLSSSNGEVHSSQPGDLARLCLLRGNFDVAILDSSLSCPGTVDLCRQVRESSEIPLIVLARCDSEQNKIAVLDTGADDCLAKPFSTLELLARVRALVRRTRRSAPAAPAVLELDGLEINLSSRLIVSHGKRARLTPKEFDLLQYLIAHPNSTVPHTTLTRIVWGHRHADLTAHLRVMINQIRRKIETDPAHPRYLLTDPWIGYRFQLPAEREPLPAYTG